MIQDPRRFKLAVCGRRSGKTNAFIHALLLGNSTYPGAIQQTGMYWWASPDNIQGRVATNFIRKFLGNFATYNAQTHIFHLVNGSEVHMKTCENEKGLRGEGLNGLVIDEAAFIKEEIVKQALMPAITDKQGFCYLASTPNGFDNWLSEFLKDTRPLPNWAHFHFPTWANPRISRESVEARKFEMGTAAWEQEHLGEIVAKSAALFNKEWFDDIFVGSLPPSYQRSVIAVDLSLGRPKSDYQAVGFCGALQGTMYCDVGLHRLSIPALLDAVDELYQRYKPDAVIFEENGFQTLVAQAFEERYQGLEQPRVVTINNTVDKTVRISRLAPLLGKGKLKILHTPHGELCVNQLRDFPAAKHDDGPDMLEVGLRGLLELGKAA